MSNMQSYETKQNPQPMSGGAYYPMAQVPPGGAYYQPGTQPPGQSGYPGQQTYVVAQQQPTVIIANPVPIQNFACHFVLSCFTFWCCGCLFGLIAFILAVLAQSQAAGSPQSARQLGRVSIGVSIAGIIISVIVTVIYIVYYVMVVNQAVSEAREKMCKYTMEGQCFSSRELAEIPLNCKRNGIYNFDGYCYYKI